MRKFITVCVCLSMVTISHSAFAKSDDETDSTDKMMNVVKENIPKKYRDELEEVNNIRKNVNNLDPTNPEELAGQVLEITKSVQALNNDKDLVKKLQGQGYFDKMLRYIQDLYNEAKKSVSED